MDEKRIIDSLRSFHDLSKAINSTLDIDRVVAMVLEKTAQLMKAEKVLILCLDRQERMLNVHAVYGFDSEEMGLKQFHNVGSFDYCIVHRGMVISLKEILPDNACKEYMNRVPFLFNMVFAPLEIDGEAVGLLGVSDERRGFTQVEREIFCSLGSQAAVAMENANLHKRLKDAFLHMAEALAEAVNIRDPYTGGHVRRVVDYSLQLAESLNLTDKEKEDLRLSAILHDIGKIGIDGAILRKAGNLSPEEEALMRKHAEIGAKILGFVDEMKDIIPGVLHHHEKFDGSGYPDRLKGEGIPLSSRIIAITDAFDALTTDRPYRAKADVPGALETLRRESKTHFDPRLVDLFSRTVQRVRSGEEVPPLAGSIAGGRPEKS